jgi:hypothetical protein
MATLVSTQTRDILQTVYGWIDELLNQEYNSYFVTLNDEFNIIEAGTFPVVVIAYNESRLEDTVYGRFTPSSGSLVILPLTLYLYENGNVGEGEDFDRDCQILSRKIIDWLRKKHQNTTEMSDHNIWSVLVDPNIRRSPPIGLREVSRYILYMEITGIREDSYE